ncbi:hypothetical protein IFM58399_09057 [Aspergillus lentulus]|uniref:LysM peptidoglycan-binding domain-containing protein n=1 Tax=Aspergillus lentulus TaxID=293939 RepID=UPI0013956D03|nr:uncharacterized protein IFM58399_09057 [Aspergillus lentulus]GFF51405.1 hypothetical protein IFM58399_09057 [Aspergillus lentulus]GFG12909.1 hypothetical protein IFM61392_07656 [Aspergillus lentulus]
MRGPDILSASILLCGATAVQIARQPEVAVHYPYQHQHTLGTSNENDTNSAPDFRGFQLWSETDKLDAKTLSKLSPACRASMTQRIYCHKKTRSLQRLGRRRWGLGLGSDALSDLVCASGCGESIAAWFKGVERDCATLEERILFPAQRGGQLWAAWNETCLKDEETERYCGDVMDDFTTSFIFINQMPVEELCSFCNVQWHQMMQTSPYSLYDKNYKSNVERINSACNLTLPTAIPNLMLFENPYVEWDRYCPGTHLSYTTSAGDTCNSIAAQFNVSSAAVRSVNWPPIDCFAIPESTRLCIPFGCKTYTLKDGDTCDSIERELDLKPWWRLSAIREYNRWVNEDCSNLHEVSDTLYGHVICVGPTGKSILDA